MSAAASSGKYAFVSIGSNLPSNAGDPRDTIMFAFGRLAELSIEPPRRSSIYLSSPVGSPPGTPDFLNAVAGIVPLEGETPLSLLHALQGIEAEAGRKRSGVRNEARALDLDLITFADEIRESNELTLPHPRAHLRLFVLQPLAEIAGEEFQLPGFDNSIKELVKWIADPQVIKKI